MKIHNIDFLYRFVWIMADIENYFSNDRKERENSRKKEKELKNEIINPDISVFGLEKRTHALSLFHLNFLFYGAAFTALMLIIFGAIFRLPLPIVCVIASFGFYISSTSFVFSIRYSYSESDLKDFKKQLEQGTQASFKINRKAEPQIWDLIPGLFMATLFCLFLLSRLS